MRFDPSTVLVDLLLDKFSVYCLSVLMSLISRLYEALLTLTLSPIVSTTSSISVPARCC